MAKLASWMVQFRADEPVKFYEMEKLMNRHRGPLLTYIISIPTVLLWAEIDGPDIFVLGFAGAWIWAAIKAFCNW